MENSSIADAAGVLKGRHRPPIGPPAFTDGLCLVHSSCLIWLDRAAAPEAASSRAAQPRNSKPQSGQRAQSARMRTWHFGHSFTGGAPSQVLRLWTQIGSTGPCRTALPPKSRTSAVRLAPMRAETSPRHLAAGSWRSVRPEHCHAGGLGHAQDRRQDLDVVVVGGRGPCSVQSSLIHSSFLGPKILDLPNLPRFTPYVSEQVRPFLHAP
jgi:hypothetical protein